jgi:hypothetical protein
MVLFLKEKKIDIFVSCGFHVFFTFLLKPEYENNIHVINH